MKVPRILMRDLILYIYSGIQSLAGYRSFGKGSIIRFPAKIWNKSCIEVGSHVFIAEGSFLSVVRVGNHIPLLVIGDDVRIGAHVHISCMLSVVIEKKVLVSDRVFIGDGIHEYHDINVPIIDQGMSAKGPVVIGQGAFIGINAVILPGVTIGRNAVIGASAIVTKNVPDYAVVVGNPARVIGRYIRSELGGEWV